MDNRERVKQHFVPQCYLRKFGIDKKRINKVSKQDGTIIEEKIKNCCQYKDFYTLFDSPKPDLIEKDILADNEENIFGELLNELHLFTKRYSKNRHLSFDFTLEKREVLARYVVVQYLRGPLYKQAKINNDKLAITAEISALCDSIGFEIEEIGLSVSPNDVHSAVITSESLINHLKRIVMAGFWEFLYSPCFFYTSDEPVTITPISYIPVSTTDALEYFDNILYPLNSHLALRITHSPNKSSLIQVDAAIRDIDFYKVNEINELIIRKAREYYFYEKNNDQNNE